MNYIFSCLLVFTMLANEPLEAQEDNRKEALCEETITVFQDVSMIGRKDRLASNITKKHDEMNARGWRFEDMEIYTENADIEGAFLTYSRPVRCGEKP